MALDRTNLGQILYSEGTAQTSGTSSSFVTLNNSLLVIVLIGQRHTGSPDVSAFGLSGNSAGLTFTSRAHTSRASGWGQMVRVLTAPVTTGESMTVSWASGGGNGLANALAYAFCYTGHDVASPIGLTLADNSTAPSDGAWSPSLGGTPDADSEVLAAITGVLNSGAAGIDHGSEWTELADGYRSDYMAWQLQAKTNVGASVVAWADVANPANYFLNPVAVAIEIKAASEGGGFQPVWARNSNQVIS